jgi:hypothetical protein
MFAHLRRPPATARSKAGAAPETDAPRIQRKPDHSGAGAPATTGPASSPPVTGPLLVDEGTDVQPGQMSKSSFLAALQEAVVPAVADSLSGTGFAADNCPTLTYWFSYYQGRGASEVERALQRYAGVSETARASDYIPIAVGRIVAGVKTWRETGQVEGAPAGGEETQAQGSEQETQAAVQSLREGGPASAVHPRAVQRALGAGNPLPTSVRGRMESSFGESFSDVRIHTDGYSGSLARGIGSHAFTVGQHVAFAPGRFQPGTVPGDLILAHELAHAVQQRRGAAPGGQSLGEGGASSLEREADGAAVRAVLATRSATGKVADDEGARAYLDVHGEHAFAEHLTRSGLRLQRCKDCGSTTPATPATPWYKETGAAEAGTARDLYFRPVTLAYRLQELLRQVDVLVTFDPASHVNKVGPGKKAPDQYIPGAVSMTQWTPADVKPKIDKILPPGGGTFVTESIISSVRDVVADYRGKHPNTFSMMQGTETAQHPELPASKATCIGTMNAAFQKLYGSSTVQTKELGGDVNAAIDVLKGKKLTSGERSFPATYVGSADRFQIRQSGEDVTLAGAGQWVLDTATAGEAGVHVFALSLANGYHSVTLMVLTGQGSPFILWKDHHGTKELDAAGLDGKIRDYAWGRYAYLLVEKYNKTNKTTHQNVGDIPDDDKKKAAEDATKPNVLNDIKQNRIAHLGPPAV